MQQADRGDASHLSLLHIENASKTYIVRGGPHPNIELSGLDYEVMLTNVVDSELANGELKLNMTRFARLQIHSLKIS